jgi:AraC family transcriptional regulator of adaptative response/methylated-DNA-[protein]-cysteine methyltransferase
MFLAVGAGGICMLAFPQGPGDPRALERLTRLWGAACLDEDPRHVAAWAEPIFGVDAPEPESIGLMVKGSAFQIQVWRALLEIPRGGLSSYQRLARAIGRPRAVRAVANAVAANPITYLIPCHRVIRSDGTLGGYRWGVACKRALLAWEAGQG